MDHLCYFCLFLLCVFARHFSNALWLPAGKGLTSWISFAMSFCEVVTFPLLSLSHWYPGSGVVLDFIKS